jgi:transcriptional regulator with XRE-family HTH domain
MAIDQGPAVQSALLRSELVWLRKDRNLTQEQVAAGLAWSPSKLMRLENGGSKITQVDLDALLTKYDVTAETTRERLQTLNQAARQKGWWYDYREDVAPTYFKYVGFEAGAALIRQFQIGFLPGLLQTAEYAEAVTIVGSVDPGKVKRIVDLRLERQSELAQRKVPPRMYFVIEEGVIHRHVGIKKDRSIMPNQLRSIADRAERDNLVTIRVIPFEAGAHPGLFGPFTLLEFDGGLPDVLYLDTGQGALTMRTDGHAEVTGYAKDFERLQEDALSEAKSIELIRSVAKTMS